LAVLQIHQRCGIAALAAEEMLIDAQHLRAATARQLSDALRDERLIPALDGGAANLVRAGQLALAHAAVMRFEDLQAVGLGRTQTWADTCKPVPEIAVAPR